MWRESRGTGAKDGDFRFCVELFSFSETVLSGSHIAAVSEGGMTNKLHRQSLIAYGAPLVETIVDCPVPQGTDVLVRIERCGVCHSDLHMQDGYFRLTGDKKLDITSGRALPFTLGHEIAGAVESAGADVTDDAAAAPGRKVAVYPWIGCGPRPACPQGEEDLCAAPRHLRI